MNVLQIDSSPIYSKSESRQLTAKIVSGLRERFPEARLKQLDLARDCLPHLTEEVFLASRVPLEALRGEQLAARLYTDALIDDLLQAQIVVIGVPMYNLSIPTQLKAWIDRVAQPGRTFRYTERGVVGLISGVKVILASSRGGIYSRGPGLEKDFQERYMRAVLLTLGITDVLVVRGEGLNMGPESRASGLQLADAALDEMLASWAHTV